MSQIPLSYRQPTKEELLFIFSSWIRSYAESQHNQIRKELKDPSTNKYQPKPDYFGYQHLLIRSILSRDTTNLLVAVDPNLPSELLAYIVYEERGPVLVCHWLYTKHTFRKLGISKELLNHAKSNTDELVFTHLGSKYHKIKNNYGSHLYIRQWAFKSPGEK